MSVRTAAPWITLLAAAAATLALGVLASAGGGALRVDSEPAGASVFIDGVFRGVTPLGVGGLCPGAHAVRLEKAGYVSAFVSADPSSGRGVGRVALEPLPTGGLDVASTPAGAEVYLDGEFRGVTPLSLDGLRPGPHAVRVEKTNRTPATASVDVPPDGRAARDFELADRVLEFLTRTAEAEPDAVLANMEFGHYLVAMNEVERGFGYYRRGLTAAGASFIRACGSGRGADAILAQRKRIKRQIQKDCRLPEPTGSKVRVLAVSVRGESQESYPRSMLTELVRARQLEAHGTKGALEKAMAALTGEYPRNPLLWSSLASLRMRSGDRDAAFDALRKGFRALRGRAEEAASLAVECLENPILTEDAEAAGQILDLCSRELARGRREAVGKETLAAAGVEVRVLRKARRGDEALALVEKVLPLETDPAGRARLELEKGRVLASMGRVEDALKLFEKLAKEAPAADVRNEACRELGALQSR
ncbi:MAG: PEGA domain-containing protein [Planctomycetota bacterium]